jgi:alkanesulfonate monooxygenase SsuD/methylene tetrahydromethanopterin reductase-like flavin-dependent oxidoreductase (luciferase family)
VKLGLSLPNFRDDPEPMLAVARAAEAAGLDGVFGFDHLFRRSPAGKLRPALEGLTMLGAVAAETSRIALGPLVARATLRPAATLATALETLHRVSRGRLVATIGSGDEESREENESFGLGFGDVDDRLRALAAAVDRSRGHGFPVWVGGTIGAIRDLAARRADGWNRWGGSVERFAQQTAHVREVAGTRPFTVSWGGLIVLGESESAADKKRTQLTPGPGVLVGGPERVAEALQAYGDAGAEWVIVGPIDSSAPDNAALLGERVKPLLASN